jgi:hypothetical protein
VTSNRASTISRPFGGVIEGEKAEIGVLIAIEAPRGADRTRFRTEEIHSPLVTSDLALRN